MIPKKICHTCHRGEDEVDFYNENWCTECFTKWLEKKRTITPIVKKTQPTDQEVQEWTVYDQQERQEIW